MKFNLKKFNEFFENENYEQDIKDFVLALFENFLNDEVNIIESKYLLLDLGFYEAEKDDVSDADNSEYCIIDFYRLSQVNKEFRTKLIKHIFDYLNSSYTDFFTDLVYEDMKIFLVYDDWKIAKRRNKLDNLNNLNK